MRIPELFSELTIWVQMTVHLWRRERNQLTAEYYRKEMLMARNPWDGFRNRQRYDRALAREKHHATIVSKLDARNVPQE